MIIGKTFYFDAAHQLPDEKCYGKCSNLHGHTYQLIVEIEGDVNKEGWVMNFKDLKNIIQERVINILDHSLINKVINIPTAENMVLWIKEQIEESIKKHNCKISMLKLYETPTSYAKIKG